MSTQLKNRDILLSVAMMSVALAAPIWLMSGNLDESLFWFIPCAALFFVGLVVPFRRTAIGLVIGAVVGVVVGCVLVVALIAGMVAMWSNYSHG